MMPRASDLICSSQMEQVQGTIRDSAESVLFFTDGVMTVSHPSSAEMELRLVLEGLVSQFGDLETAQSDAQGERDLFFTDGAGSGHPSSAEIGAEAGLLEGLVSQFGDLETALSDAQGERDLRAGSGHPSSAEIGAEAGLLEGLVSQFGDQMASRIRPSEQCRDWS